MIKNKKGFTIEEAVKLAFVAFIFILTFLFAGKIYAAVFGEKDDDSSANFDRLASKIQELSNNGRKLDYAEINYFLGAERAVAGYNKVWSAEANAPIIGMKIEKPGFCGDRACLCLYKGLDLNTKPKKPCIKFEKVAYFLKDKDISTIFGISGTEQTVSGFYKPPMPELFTKEEYKYLMISGTFSLNKNQVVLYIEKYQNDLGEVVFYIAQINDATRDKIKQRKQHIDKENKQ